MNRQHSKYVSTPIRAAAKKSSTEALRVSEGYLAMALEAAGAGTWAWDVSTQRSTWDPRCHELYGFDSAEVPSFEHWLGRIHPEDRTRVEARIHALAETGADSTWHATFRALVPAKGERWMEVLGRIERDAGGRALAFRGINLDVTERKQAEEALRVALQRSQEVAHVGHWIWDPATNHVAWSDEVYRIYGVPRDFDCQLDSIFRFIHPDDLGRVVRFLGLMPESRDPEESVEHRIMRPDGTIRHVLGTKASCVRDAHGNVVQVSGVVHDITARKRAEAEILRIGEEERQRLGADLHDGVLQELAGIAYLATSLRHELEREAHPLAAKSQRIQHTLENAIDHTRRLALAMDPTVPGGTGLMGALRQLAETVSERHDLACRFESAQAVSFDDAGVANQLYRIAQEATRNAVRHSGARHVTIVLSEAGEETCLVVRDDGRGLPDELERNPGMGLQVMRYRAGLVGGRLTIRNGTEGGTEVHCCLPRHAKLREA